MTVHDPAAIEAARKVAPELAYADSVELACAGADVVLHLTEWPEYAALDPVALSRVVASPRVVDARNKLPRQAWKDAGWSYVGLGRDGQPAAARLEAVVA